MTVNKIIKIVMIISVTVLFTNCPSTVTCVYLVNNSDENIYFNSNYHIFSINDESHHYSGEKNIAFSGEFAQIVDLLMGGPVVSPDRATREDYRQLVERDLKYKNREAVKFTYNEKGYILSTEDIVELIMTRSVFTSEGIPGFGYFINITDIVDYFDAGEPELLEESIN